MKFYTELSNVYDIVFPLDEDTVKFLSQYMKPGDNVLDLACGTGEYSIALAELGAKVIGVDLNGNMIKAAKEKAKNLDAIFIEEDMTRLANINEKKFNMVFCIGNSIVHLNGKNEIESFIHRIYSLLNENGVMIIQTINFDRILKYKIDSLPTIDKTDVGVRLIRKYNYNETEDILNFDTELIIKDESGEKKYFNSVPLIMLKKNEIVSMIERTGFKTIEVYGGFNKKEYNYESYAMIVRAIK